MKNQKVGAVIVAAGASSRMEGIDKVFAEFGEKPLLAWSTQIFQDCNAVDEIVIVLGRSNLKKGEQLQQKYGWKKVSAICGGGARRQDSVRNGLAKLSDCQWVIIHDGARPFVSEEMINRGMKEASVTGSAVAAVPVTDTIKRVNPDGLVEATPQRDALMAVQTPQIFRFDIIEKAHQQISEDVTDDAAMAEKLGQRVMVFAGSYDNIKVTTPQDLALAEIILKNQKGSK